jgi:hypothetical protein
LRVTPYWAVEIHRAGPGPWLDQGRTGYHWHLWCLDRGRGAAKCR